MNTAADAWGVGAIVFLILFFIVMLLIHGETERVNRGNLCRPDSKPRSVVPMMLYPSSFDVQKGANQLSNNKHSNGSSTEWAAYRSDSGRFVKPVQAYPAALHNQKGKRLCGLFKCQTCKRWWKSHLVHPKNEGMSTSSYYCQDCANCGATASPYAIVPAVCDGCHSEQCVCTYEERRRNADIDKPHRRELCELCKKGIRHLSSAPSQHRGIVRGHLAF